MAVFCQGNMWNRRDQVDLFCITTNGTLRRDGKLVMGRGIAFEAISQFPEIQKTAGEAIRTFNEARIKRGDPPSPYGLVTLRKYEPFVGLFQVKYNWWEQADVNLIKFSAQKLHQFAVDNPHKIIVLNFPGIGNGKLSEETVRPIVETLPGNVEIWKR